MSKEKKTNIPVSIKTRLLNLSRESRLDYMKLLVRYMQERLLYRISMSAYREHLLLKGSALLYAYQPFDARPTLDFIQQLRTYGSELEILKPQSLREQFKRELEKQLALYK